MDKLCALKINVRGLNSRKGMLFREEVGVEVGRLGDTGLADYVRTV